MTTLYQILALIGAALIIWIIYRQIKGRPDQFSRENISKSFTTLGILAIGLIIFVTILVYIVRLT